MVAVDAQARIAFSSNRDGGNLRDGYQSAQTSPIIAMVILMEADVSNRDGHVITVYPLLTSTPMGGISKTSLTILATGNPPGR